jgi:hypothetical protein
LRLSEAGGAQRDRYLTAAWSGKPPPEIIHTPFARNVGALWEH